MPEGILVAIVVLIAVSFDFTNGFHDTANAIATSVSTHALSPRAAVILSAVMNFVGAFVTLKVAATIGSGVASPTKVTLVMVTAALLGAITWNLFTWYRGLPSSSTHALIGGLIGAALVGLGFSGVQWHIVLTKMIIPLVVSPLLGFAFAYLGMLVILWIFRHSRPRQVNRGFRLAQILSAAFVSFSHGTNDSQKTMGIITLALVSGHFLSHFQVPLWVIVASASAMAFGTYAGGWRIIKTVGTRLYKIEPAAGFDAQTVSAIIIQGASHFGFPVSTTHMVTGSILGAGASQSASAVRWGVGINILAAWIVTIPAAALVAGVLYFFLHFIAR
ncbi:MAG: inorganic phosphate transporter [Chloroflexota bacterium]|nr:inorganic phosphate transporter [Chloroflexota bacterium]